MTLDLGPILAEPIGREYKSFPPTHPNGVATRIGDVEGRRWKALAGDLTFPAVLINRRTLHANIELLAAWCGERGVSLAPHVKTPLAPQIAEMQLAAGAWGLTVATVHHAAVMRQFGATRLLMANQLLDGAALRWVAAELAEDPSFEFTCLVDSEAGIALMDENLEAAGFHGELQVLVELGAERGRCGCRSLDEARAVARTAARSPRLRLVGVEVYENVFEEDNLQRRLALIDATLDRVRSTVEILDGEGLFAAQEIIVSGGGSLYFDRVVERLARGWSTTLPVRLVLRSGSYITQDDQAYNELSPLAGRAVDEMGRGRLDQALEAWGMVLSRPEPGLAVIGLGKRDVAHDRGFPTPFALKRRGAPVEFISDMEVLSLNDQHARVRVAPGSAVGPGDLVGCRISHPCTTFDNWRLLPMVDETYQVVDAIRCYL